MEKDIVLFEVKNNIAYISLNNPPRNVLTMELLNRLKEILSVLEDKKCEAKVAVLRSNLLGIFSAGADIKHMVNLNVEESKQFSKIGQDIAKRLEFLPIPVIAALDGFVLGGGSELSLAADFRIASDKVYIGQPEINIGVIPGWGGSQRLPRTVGIANARLITYTGRKFSAEDALKMGYVDRVVPQSELYKEVDTLAMELSLKGRVALAAMKNAMHLSWDLPIDKSLMLERELWGILFATHDQKEGMNAFLEHRNPSFTDSRKSLDLLKTINKEEKDMIDGIGMPKSLQGVYDYDPVSTYTKISTLGVEISSLYLSQSQRFMEEWSRWLNGGK